MRFLAPRFVLLSALAAIIVAAGCGKDATTNPGPDPKSDFSLADVNTTSPRAGESVSPRDYLQKVSAWYFGHAT